MTSGAETVIRGRRVLTTDGLRPAAIHIAGGRIIAVTGLEPVDAGVNLVEAGDALVFPGLVDTHVHLNQPGRTEWEGIATGTAAAAAGGVTTLVDMPLNSIPATTSVQALREKRAAAEGCRVDLGFLGGVVPGNTGELAPLHAAGVLGFKCFLPPSGVAEFAPVEFRDLEEALPVLAALDQVLMVHAELPGLLILPEGDPRRHATWLATRPVEAEVRAVEAMIDLARRHRARVHIVHVSAPETVRWLTQARHEGLEVTGETCPHYLAFSAEQIPDGAVEFKCAPPIRDGARRDGLWSALMDGGLDLIVSDHSPAPPARKQGDFLSAWGGIAAVQLRLSAVWTAARRRGLPPERLGRWLAEAPARLVGLAGRKGSIAVGRDADLVLWHPEHEFTVTPELLRQRHPITPWMGHRLAGVVEATYLRGELVYHRERPDGKPSGRLLSSTNR